MNETEARRILEIMIEENNALSGSFCYVDWEPGKDEITIDGLLSLDEVIAIAWWVTNKNVEKDP